MNAFDKTYVVKGEPAKRIRELFEPADRIDSGTKWISWGEATFKRRYGKETKVSLFMGKPAHLGIFKIDGQFFECARPDQLNEITDLAGMKVDAQLMPDQWWIQP